MASDHDHALGAITDSILESYRQHGGLAHVEGSNLPSREVLWGVVEDLLRTLFPGFLEATDRAEELAERTAARVRSIAQRLRAEIEKGIRFGDGDARPPIPGAAGSGDGQAAAGDERDARRTGDPRGRAEHATLALLAALPSLRAVLASDVQAAYDGDPAARSLEEIVLAYPGLQAIAVYRLAHVLYADEVPLVPRVMTEYAHSRTGIDIHPGASIGPRFFIDHGTGVVIGETCVIGTGVKIYQGVTLGARSFPRDERGRVIRGTKRHPDIEDGVTIYSGATILGAVRIGRRSMIGGNVWLTESVPPDTRIVVRTPQQVQVDGPVHDFQI